ncbi:Bcr/CflA family efflux MFS transporter [Mucilaginibacter limnophilus]|uniref:Bcr/CflA family efflux MFS transporter n=1 Tax=Mucilaginibacter limnophilus TaxID=1932778 RepID=A0A437MQB6_9SPHI|nr:multidrug effflux MFS transporter [Mucilaginibacter limnophilus]RVT99842.1 Bcr/CflA family efflux MFS transporter [Mucilaginibacter limnophilus]
MTRKKHFFLVLILGTLTALGPFSIDMYLPGFPAMAKYLHTDVPGVALSLSGFFIGLAAGQLLYGPLLDKYGRKKPLYIGLCVYIVASVCCALAQSLEMLIAVRFIQAIGSCAAAVASMAMVRDLFPVNENAKIFALLMLVVGTSPMIAPTVGGYVTAGPGWQWVFIILAIMAALILLAVALVLPSSYVPDKTISLRPKPIITGFLTVFKNPQFYTYTFTGSFAFAGLFAYVSGSPQVFMEIYHLDDKTYGWIFAGLSVALIGASQLNSLVLRKFTSEQIIRVTLSVQSIVSIVFAMGAYAGVFDLAGTIVMLFLFLACVGFINPNAIALTLAPFSKNAGTASSLFGAIQLGIGSLVTVTMSEFKAHSTVPLAIVMCITALLAFGLHFISVRVNRGKFVSVDDATAVAAVH